jgi:hypothetical protein
MVPYTKILNLENNFERNYNTKFEKEIIDHIKTGNIIFAETLIRLNLDINPKSPQLLNLLGILLASINLPHLSIKYFEEALKEAPDWSKPNNNLIEIKNYLEGNSTKNLAKPKERFILVKAWGYGFFSDLNHVIGQLLVAELTNRIPIIFWGSNSIFKDKNMPNAFNLYFEPINSWQIIDLKKEYTFWPPKWNFENIISTEEINKRNGLYSKISGIYFFGRDETVVVSDFYTGIVELLPYIPKDNLLYDLSVDDIFRYLLKKYINPKSYILEIIDNFIKKNSLSDNFIAVHARGSDKVKEFDDLGQLNSMYENIIDKFLLENKCSKIFLMTDDIKLKDFFFKIYGDSLVTTDCKRTDNDKGVHYQAEVNGKELATEVITDVYIAAKACAFIGNGASNPSCFVNYLKNWPKNRIEIFLNNNNDRQTQFFLHRP